MKKISNFILCLMFFGMLNPAVAEVTSNTTVKSITRSNEKLTKPEFNILLARLKEIKHLDIKSLSLKDRNVLKSEVKDINQKVQKDGAGIYLSFTAILIIIILLLVL